MRRYAKISQIRPNFRFVDVTTTLVKIQIPNSDIRNGPIQQGSKDLP